MVFKLDIRANKDYEGNEVDLPSISFGDAATFIWTQTSDLDDPGNTKSDKSQKLRLQGGKIED